MPERRKHSRAKVLVLLDFYVEGAISSRSRGVISNIGLGGCRLETGVKLPLESVVVLKCELDEKTGLDVKGQVIWVKEGVHTTTHGIRFLDLGFLKKMKLKDYVSAHLAEG